MIDVPPSACRRSPHRWRDPETRAWSHTTVGGRIEPLGRTRRDLTTVAAQQQPRLRPNAGGRGRRRFGKLIVPRSSGGDRMRVCRQSSPSTRLPEQKYYIM